MELTILLEKYYLPSDKERLLGIMNSLGIHDGIAASILEFYCECPLKDPEAFNSQLVLTINEVITITNKALSELQDTVQKNEFRNELTILGVYLIKETFEKSKYSKTRYFKILRTTIQKVYKKNNWDFTELEKLLRLDRIEQLQNDNNDNSRTTLIKSNSTYLEWKGHKAIDIFYDDVKNYFQIKNISPFYLMFQPMDSEFEIQIKTEQLMTFILLFEKLHKSGTIKIKKSRGLYKYLQAHLKPVTGVFPLKDFRKLKYDFKKKHIDYKTAESEIDRVFGKNFASGTIGR